MRFFGILFLNNPGIIDSDRSQVRDFFDCRMMLPLSAYVGFVASLSFVMPLGCHSVSRYFMVFQDISRVDG